MARMKELFQVQVRMTLAQKRALAKAAKAAQVPIRALCLSRIFGADADGARDTSSKPVTVKP